MGADIALSDMNWYRQYDIDFALMPGFKWNMGNHWTLSGKVYVPLVSQVTLFYAGWRPSILSISKEVKVGELCIKGSAGLFSNQRYGLDMKAFLPVTNWFALETQLGLTGLVAFRELNGDPCFKMSPMGRFTGTIGGDIYISRWNTQLRGTIGKYVYGDYGIQCEAMRHFNHSTVSLFGRWSNRAGIEGKFMDGADAGFTVTIMIPPYRRSNKFFHIRPISNHFLEYKINANSYINNLYDTDAEENVRDGWFSRDLLNWGCHNMEPDHSINN